MLNTLKIGTKLLIGFLLVILLLVVVGGIGYYALSRCQSGFKDLNEQIKITQGISDATDNLYLAQLASANFSATKDVAYSDQVSALSEKAATAADATSQLFTIPENKNKANEVVKNAKEFEKTDNLWKEQQLRINQLEATRFTLAADIAKDISELIDQVLETYEGLEKEQKPITTKHVRNYGTAVGALETVELIRRLNRDLTIAATDPKKAERINEILKEVGTAYDRFDKECTEMLENFITDTAKAKVTKAQDLMKEWKDANGESRACVLKQAELQKEEDRIAAAIMKDTEDLVSGVKARVTSVSNDTQSTVNSSVTIIVVTMVLAAIVGIICAFVLTSNITTGLKYAVGLMNKVAVEGDLSAELEQVYLNRGDEIGALAHGLKSVLGDYHAIDSMANSLAGGDWRVEIKSKGELDSMNQGLGKMVDQVNQALAEINESVKQVATGANEVSSAATTLSSGAQESAASLEEITASMSEISSQTKTNAQSATEARDLAKKATTAASEGQQAMQDMTSAMERITQNSNEIQRVIKVIDDIAFQTNLLALNAAVEAARAGTHGKGFAVVAEEVRNLAARSAKAAKETSDLISTSGKEIGQGGEVATRTSEVLNTIVEQIKQTTDLVAGIAVASNEQAQGVEQVTIGLQQIDAVTQQNTAAAEESASAANEMSGMATNLMQLVARFQLRK